MDRFGIYIFYALLFTTVVLIVEGLYLFLRYRSPAEKAANERMKLIQQTDDTHIGLTLLKKRNRASTGSRFSDHIESQLWAANLRISGLPFILLTVAIILFLFLIFSFAMDFAVFLALPLAVIFGCLLPYLYIRLKAASRQKLFTEQLVPAIDLVSRGLQAGHPAAVALEIVSKEMPDPIGTEFGLAIDEISYGLDRHIALSNIGKRFPSPDFKFFVSALEIQRETGGNLVEVLNNLTSVMRSRAAMRKKIKAMSAEGRFTAIVVGLLPFAVATIISILNNDYYPQHFDNPVFYISMAIPFTLYLLGMYWIFKMINIRI